MEGPAYTFISSLYIRCVLGTEPNPIFFVYNSDSDEACSDLYDDYTVVDDSLLGATVTFAAGPSSTPASGKRRRDRGRSSRQSRRQPNV